MGIVTRNKPLGKNILTVGEGCQYDTIATAVTAAAAVASASSPQVVQLAPGTYTLTEALVLPDYVSLVGAGMLNTVVSKSGLIANAVADRMALYLGTDSELHNLCVKHEREVETLAAMDATTGLTAGSEVALAADAVVYDTRVTGNAASVKCTLGAEFAGGRVCLIPFASGLDATHGVRFKLRIRSDAASAAGTNIQVVLATAADGTGTTATENTYPMSADRWYEVSIANHAAVTYLSMAIHAAVGMAGQVIWIDKLEYAYSSHIPVVSCVGKSTTATGTQIINNCWLQGDDDAMITGAQGESQSTIYLLNSFLRGRYDVLRCGAATYHIRNCDLRIIFDGIDTGQHRVLTTSTSTVYADNSIFECVAPSGIAQSGTQATRMMCAVWQDDSDLVARHCVCRVQSLDDASGVDPKALDLDASDAKSAFISHCLLSAATAGSGTAYHIGCTIGWVDEPIVLDSCSTEETYSEGAIFTALSSTGLLTVSA